MSTLPNIMELVATLQEEIRNLKGERDLAYQQALVESQRAEGLEIQLAVARVAEEKQVSLNADLIMLIKRLQERGTTQ